MSKYKRIGLSFHEWDLEKLDKIAKQMGESRSRAVTRLVDFYLRYKEYTKLNVFEILNNRELTDVMKEKDILSAMDMLKEKGWLKSSEK